MASTTRLYRRTLKDAAFNILQEGRIAGYGDSGKLHNYFAEETLEKLGTRAGVRADHPLEIVLDPSLRPNVGSSRRGRKAFAQERADAPKDEAAQDDEEEDEEMERPACAVASEVSPRASSPSAAAAASSDPANISPASTPRLREVLDVQRRGQVQTCPQCSQRIILGQYICQHCNKGLRKRIPHDITRRNLASARHQYVGNIATLTGKAVADLTEGDLRGVHGHDVMRGIISLDANAIAQARQASKRAASDGHDSVYIRFTGDRTYALRMIEAGYNQRTMRQRDALIQAILPNPGRSHSQRRFWHRGVVVALRVRREATISVPPASASLTRR